MRTGSSGRGGGQALTLGVLLCGGFLHLCAFVCMSVYHELRLRQLEVSRFSKARVVIKVVKVNSPHAWITGCPLFSTSYISVYFLVHSWTRPQSSANEGKLSQTSAWRSRAPILLTVIKILKVVFVLKYLPKRTIIFALQPENLWQRHPKTTRVTSTADQFHADIVFFVSKIMCNSCNCALRMINFEFKKIPLL